MHRITLRIANDLRSLCSPLASPRLALFFVSLRLHLNGLGVCRFVTCAELVENGDELGVGDAVRRHNTIGVVEERMMRIVHTLPLASMRGGTYAGTETTSSESYPQARASAPPLRNFCLSLLTGCLVLVHWDTL